MNTQDLINHSKNTQAQAKEILESTKLLDILNKYGDVHMIGSFPLNIMYGPDIDILVETKNIKKSSLEALQEIAEKSVFRKIEYGDFVNFPKTNRPSGYILVLKTEIGKVEWEIEVWFLDNASSQLEYQKQLGSKLTEQKRIEILQAKHKRGSSKISKESLSSFEIYKKILGK